MTLRRLLTIGFVLAANVAYAQNLPPVAVASPAVSFGPVPYTVQFSTAP